MLHSRSGALANISSPTRSRTSTLPCYLDRAQSGPRCARPPSERLRTPRIREPITSETATPAAWPPARALPSGKVRRTSRQRPTSPTSQTCSRQASPPSGQPRSQRRPSQAYPGSDQPLSQRRPSQAYARAATSTSPSSPAIERPRSRPRRRFTPGRQVHILENVLNLVRANSHGGNESSHLDPKPAPNDVKRFTPCVRRRLTTDFHAPVTRLPSRRVAVHIVKCAACPKC
jgi:hypothetical protein